jgi:molybdenum cofactor synthesis domain-containing protein
MTATGSGASAARPEVVRIGIVTVSDRASAGVYEDKGGPAIREFLEKHLTNQWQPVARVISDDVQTIARTLRDLADLEHCSLIVTTGGTGPAARDVTPEATEMVCQKMMPGFGELMRAVSLQVVPTAILSRQTAVVDCRVPHCGVASDSLLRRLDRRSATRSGRRSRSVPTKGRLEPRRTALRAGHRHGPAATRVSQRRG